MGYTDALLKLQYLCLGHRPLKLSVDGHVVTKSFAKASSVDLPKTVTSSG